MTETTSPPISTADRDKAKKPCYCGRYYPDDLCPCRRMARDMRLMERDRAIAAQQDRQTEGIQ